MATQCESCLKWFGKTYKTWTGSIAFGRNEQLCFDCLCEKDQEEVRKAESVAYKIKSPEAAWLLFGIE